MGSLLIGPLAPDATGASPTLRSDRAAHSSAATLRGFVTAGFGRTGDLVIRD
jgi:hypothetical protein